MQGLMPQHATAGTVNLYCNIGSASLFSHGSAIIRLSNGNRLLLSQSHLYRREKS